MHKTTWLQINRYFECSLRLAMNYSFHATILYYDTRAIFLKKRFYSLFWAFGAIFEENQVTFTVFERQPTLVGASNDSFEVLKDRPIVIRKISVVEVPNIILRNHLVNEVLNSVGEEGWTFGVPLLTAILRLNYLVSEEKMRGSAICRVRVIVNLASFSENGV